MMISGGDGYSGKRFATIIGTMLMAAGFALVPLSDQAFTQNLNVHPIPELKDRGEDREPGREQRTGHTSHHSHQHENDRILHITDYLSQVPEIREAYESYLLMKEERPAELEALQVAETYDVGDTRMFYVYNYEESTGSSSTYDEKEFELRAVGEIAQIWVETDEIGPDKINEEVVSSMMEALEKQTPPRSVNSDQGIIQNNIELFARGHRELVPDPSGSGMIKFLVTNVQDGWDPEEGGPYIAGFFNRLDLAAGSNNSNGAAILYINSNPGIYGFDSAGTVDPRRPLGTIAHEFQHLIQAGRDALNTFMDEGQSELAEILNGFDARNMQFLDMPDEVSGDVESNAAPGFLRWRQGEDEVLYDYQRAQLFHSYMYERTGKAIGGLTQSRREHQPWVQYQNILNEMDQDLEFTEVLAEFYVTNWLNKVNHETYSYSLPQQSSVRVSVPGREFGSSERPWLRNERVSLQYGSAKYTHWPQVENLWIELDSPDQIIHYLITESYSGAIDVFRVEEPEITLTDRYQSVVLVSVNTVRVQNATYGTRHFTYTAEWRPDSYRVVDLSYARQPAFFTELPDHPVDADDTFVARAMAVRINPDSDGILQGVEFPLLDSRDFEAVTGTGKLRISVSDSRLLTGSGSDAIYVPDNELVSTEIDFSQLRAGINTVDLSGHEIELQSGGQYHVSFSVVDESMDGLLRFMVDAGSDNQGDSDYYPVRTVSRGEDGDGDTYWRTFRGDPDRSNHYDNKNLVMNVRILQETDLPDEFPAIVETDNFEILRNYPNPFNTSTTIYFNIPEEVEGSTPVRIDVFDITGRWVKMLTHSALQAGRHPVTFEAGNLASGTYLVRMQASGTFDTHKIMLVK